MIQLSPAAITEILRLQAKQPAASALRLATAPKGCLERSYTMQFDPQFTVGDQAMMVAEGLQITIHESVLPELQGLVIDYSEDMMGGGFRFHNPNARQVCSCGNSFALSDRPVTAPEEIS